MSRTDPHKIETKSKNIFRSIIDSNKYCDALVRDINERDYGIDFMVELFENENPTGKIAFIQLKGTQKEIESLKKSDEISCPGISNSSLSYGEQNNIPFIIVYLSIETKEFYFIDIQSLNLNFNSESTNNITIRIPVKNKCDENNVEKFIDTIKKYYSNK